MKLVITPKAQDQLLAALENEDFVRLSVKPGGCAGMSYEMGVDNAVNKDDQVVYEANKLRVITDPESAQFLDGLNIDYSDDLVQAGFRISNPNAQNSCGCGSSFGC